MKIVEPSVKIESYLDPDIVEAQLEMVAAAGRTAWKSDAKGTPEDFIRKIIYQHGHESVIEHLSVSMRVICDRGVTHEFVRHRIASYTQESTRYCNYGKEKFGQEITIVEPCFWKNESKKSLTMNKWEVWRQAMNTCERAYLDLLELGATPQEARSVLPNSLKTEIVATLNMRGWRHFFDMRLPKNAHPQMRQVASMILDEMRTVGYGVFFEDKEGGVRSILKG